MQLFSLLKTQVCTKRNPNTIKARVMQLLNNISLDDLQHCFQQWKIYMDWYMGGLPGELNEELVTLCSFSNLSVTSPISKLILQSFCCFTYITAHSPTLPLLHLCHSSFSNPSFASPASQALHLIHLASHPWTGIGIRRESTLKKTIFSGVNFHK